MYIHFKKDRLLNSSCIFRSDDAHLLGIDSDPFSAQSHRFAKTWDSINAQTEDNFRFSLKTIVDQFTHLPKGVHNVVCVVTYLNDHDYFLNAIESILRQTRKPDSIIIGVDAASNERSSYDLEEALSHLQAAGISAIIRHFSGLNGPYHILNTIVCELDDSSYLWLHDSDDVSHPTRLEKQLKFMDYHKLDMCGSFELRFNQAGFELFQYPINVSRALLTEPGHCMLWPSSLIRIALWRRLAGCSDYYRFGADTEFQLRACFVARIGNTPSFLYARRKRMNSLTTSLQTGHRSWIRGYINSIYKAEYYQRQMIRSSGNIPLLTPRFIKEGSRDSGVRSVEELTEVIIQS